MTAVGRLEDAASALPNAPALSDGQRWLSNAELHALVTTTPAPSGDDHARPVVPVDAGDSIAGLITLLAAESRGAVPMVLAPTWPASTRDTVLAHLTTAIKEFSAIKESAGPLLAVLTSGTSDRPRVVLRELESWSASIRPFDRVAGLVDDDVIWAPGSLASTLTLFACWHALATGRPVIASGAWRSPTPFLSSASFDDPGLPPKPAGLAAAPTATVVHAVPAVLDGVLALAEAGSLPRLRLAVVAGAHPAPALRERASALGVRLMEYYGAAELSFVAVDPDGRGLVPFPGVDIAIRGSDGTVVRDGGDGDVWVRSPYLARGYLSVDSPPSGPLRSNDGWATVGDRGRLLSGGTIEVAGRGESAVDIGGHTVPLDDVESVLRNVPGVLEVVCLAEPRGLLGTRLVAVVRPRAGTDPRPALRAAARSSLPRPSRPTRWVLLDALPRTAAGKLSRTALADLVAGGG